MGKVNYSLVQRRNPVKKDAPKLFYASAQKTGDLTYEEIQKSISSRTTATPGDVSCVIESLLADIAAGLKAGKSVFLDKFGKFRLSLGSKGAATMKEFTTDMIRDHPHRVHSCQEPAPLQEGPAVRAHDHQGGAEGCAEGEDERGHCHRRRQH
jgi:predicted histone-like DNA-binding protein